MANFIPRLEFNDISIVGTTSVGSAVITAVPSTALVVVGMIINHANFPANSYVLSKGASTVTISANATIASVLATLPLFERFDFVYPSDTQKGEPVYMPTEVISDSINGTRQVQINNIISKIDLEFKFLSKERKEALRDRWYLTWAYLGKAFRYYESKDVNTYVEYELDSLDFNPKRDFPKLGDFLYKISLKFRRVYL